MSASGRIRRLGLIGACAALLLLGTAPLARADSNDPTIFDPPGVALLFATQAERKLELDMLEHLGADTVRIPVNWKNYAPRPHSRTKPRGFDASDPTDYPSRGFGELDSLVRDVTSRGFNALMTPAGPAPRWATAGGSKGLNRPDPAEFEQFVEAVGERYSGSCFCGTPSPLPRVSFWSVWNEPNLFLFIHPQVVHGRVVSAEIYRHLFLAAQAGLRRSGHGGDQLLIGETAPSRGTNSSNPLDFLRTVFCLDRRWRPVGHCRPIAATGWAQHPYLPGIAPWEKPKKDYIAIGSLGRLTRALKLAYDAGATSIRLPVYITEFGIESYPEPASRFGVTPEQQAEFLGISEFLLYENPQVRSFAQYRIKDDPGRLSYLDFQTGLRFADGEPKPSWYAFPMTLVARRIDSGDVELWGHVRPGPGFQKVQLEYRDEGGPAQPLTSAETDADGYFDLISASQPGREFRATCTLPDGEVLQGPWIRSYSFAA